MDSTRTTSPSSSLSRRVAAAIAKSDAAAASALEAQRAADEAKASASKFKKCPHIKGEPELAVVKKYLKKAKESARGAKDSPTTLAAEVAEDAAAASDWPLKLRLKVWLAKCTVGLAKIEAESASRSAAEVAKASAALVKKARQVAAAWVRGERWCDGDGVEECPICMVEFEVGVKVGSLACCHVFHYECLMEWLERSSCCPLCRHDIYVYS